MGFRSTYDYNWYQLTKCGHIRSELLPDTHFRIGCNIGLQSAGQSYRTEPWIVSSNPDVGYPARTESRVRSICKGTSLCRRSALRICSVGEHLPQSRGDEGMYWRTRSRIRDVSKPDGVSTTERRNSGVHQVAGNPFSVRGLHNTAIMQ